MQEAEPGRTTPLLGVHAGGTELLVEVNPALAEEDNMLAMWLGAEDTKLNGVVGVVATELVADEEHTADKQDSELGMLVIDRTTLENVENGHTRKGA